VRITVEVVEEEGEMKRHLTEEDIRKIFTDPNSLRKALVLWKTAERRSLDLVRKMINERKRRRER